jgi:elongation factor G
MDCQHPEDYDLVVRAADVTSFVTLAEPVDGECRHFRQACEPGMYGHVRLRIEPFAGPLHCRVEWCVNESEIPQCYRDATIAGIRDANNEPVANTEHTYAVFLRVCVVGGSYHEIDSREVSFKIAGRLAFREALRKASLLAL